jgi:hypothetical protein
VNASTNLDARASAPLQTPRGTRIAALVAAVLTTFTMVVGVVGLAAAATTNVVISSGSRLNSGQVLITANNTQLAMQSDGNLVVYNPSHSPLWNSGTSGQPGNYAVMQSDGNFVVYSAAGQWRWQSVTNGPGSSNAYAAIQGDGNFVIYSSAGKALWNSNYDTKAQAAIAWMKARIGNTSFEGLCETAVEDAFGNTFRYATATADWQAHAATLHTSLPAPRGALVFYNTSANGHVAISMGDGSSIISTSVSGRIGIASVGYFQNFRGWAYTTG